MDIVVTFQDGQWLVKPDPAIVQIGEPVTWLLRWPRSTTKRVRWNIYFTPFSRLHGLTVTTQNTGLRSLINANQAVEKALQGADKDVEEIADHNGVAGPVFPDHIGHYKYGIRATDPDSQKDIGNDDPMLIVRP